jgi:hypothetical protein
VVGLVPDRGDLVVADVRAERGHNHQGAVEVVADLVAIQLGAGDAVAAELLGRVAEA